MDFDCATNLPEHVLYRIVRCDAKGRSFGTPRNPSVPTMEEFNPRMVEVAASELVQLIVGVRHGLHPEQLDRVAELADGELIRMQWDDPISATQAENGLCLTGGHHRIHEIMRRTANGQVDATTTIGILIHD